MGTTTREAPDDASREAQHLTESAHVSGAVRHQPPELRRRVAVARPVVADQRQASVGCVLHPVAVQHARVGRADLDKHHATAVARHLRAQPAAVRGVNVPRSR
jgi:hypothetical protein